MFNVEVDIVFPNALARNENFVFYLSHLFIYLFIHPSIYSSIYLFTYLSIYLFIYLVIYLFTIYFMLLTSSFISGFFFFSHIYYSQSYFHLITREKEKRKNGPGMDIICHSVAQSTNFLNPMFYLLYLSPNLVNLFVAMCEFYLLFSFLLYLLFKDIFLVWSWLTVYCRTFFLNFY